MFETPNGTSENREGIYIYLNHAAASISKTLGIEITEKNVDSIARQIDLKPFKIGSRTALKRGDFEAKFTDFVSKSTEAVAKQKENRLSGATKYNEKIDGIFAFWEYVFIQRKDSISLREEMLDFLRFYNRDLFGSWTGEDLLTFVTSRNSRKGSEDSVNKRANRKANLSSYLLYNPAKASDRLRDGLHSKLSQSEERENTQSEIYMPN